ncbi:YggT family protein [Sutterella sp.]|uniref:YggT family protein n=1 Tax=Sutterella sp. TaxID=1981025 RepID=UPI0026DFE54D|nr:YggT family protein [Sutterella sp.]MDO5531849.1 YggT family protein [Sutterella sp.]
MLASALHFIFGIVFGFFGAILLLRAWLYYWALSPRHPLCQLCKQMSDWLVGPLSKTFKSKGGVDWACLVAALLTAVIAVVVNRTIGYGFTTPVALIIAPFAMVARWALEMISWGTIIWCVMTWTNREHMMTYTLAMLLDPFMRPIRRVVPTFKGFDFAPLILVVVANLLLMIAIPLSRGFFYF